MISFIEWNVRGGMFDQSVRGMRYVPDSIRAAILEELEACEKILERTIRVDGWCRFEEYVRSAMARRLNVLVEDSQQEKST